MPPWPRARLSVRAGNAFLTPPTRERLQCEGRIVRSSAEGRGIYKIALNQYLYLTAYNKYITQFFSLYLLCEVSYHNVIRRILCEYVRPMLCFIHMKTKKKPVKETLTVRIAPAKRRKLDKVATARKVDRSAVISEALDQYLAFEQWQLERIKEGLRQANAGEFATEDEVRKAFARFGV